MRNVALLFVAAFGISVASARVAHASTCTPTAVSYNVFVGAGFVPFKVAYISCTEFSGPFMINLYQDTPAASCPVMDMDSAKIVLGMAQSAKLNGKTIQLSWTNTWCYQSPGPNRQ